MKRLFGKDMAELWTRNLIIMVVAVFVMRFGEGVLGGARTNFFVDTLGLTDGQVLWLEGIREIPGLALIFIAALSMHLPLSWRAAAWVFVVGIGYMLYALVNSYLALLAVAVFTSLGFHGYMPIGPVLAMGLATKDTRGRVLGLIASVGSLATIVGMGVLAVVTRLFQTMSLRWSYAIGGGIILIAAVLFLRLPKELGNTHTKQPRVVLKRRYWLYYVLTFFEGSRKEVLGTFTTLVLVSVFRWKVWEISSLLLVSAIVNLLLSPYLGALVDRFGARVTLAASYAVLVACCVGYAVIPNPIILAGLFVLIRLAVIMSMGLSIYVNQIAPPEELTPTLSAGTSINHVTSVAMPIVAGALLPLIKYNGLFLGTAALVAISLPFALAMQSHEPMEIQPQPVMAE